MFKTNKGWAVLGDILMENIGSKLNLKKDSLNIKIEI